ncbi:MAG: DUF1302 family protein [Myxococcota bacterium]
MRIRAIASVALLCACALPATAVEFYDGRVQVHGYAETQLRALNEKFEQELDLAQWYNVLNVEVEVDVLPEGLGPIDLMSVYVRAEGRYDALYSEGFRIFHSVDTYGNGARRLPERLRDARDPDFGGVVPGPEGPVDRHLSRRPTPFAPEGERRGIPEFDSFFRQAGGDNRLGTADDPGRYASAALLDYQFALREFRGPDSQGTQVLGPWLPRNLVRSVALNADRANPFRGRIPPTALATGTDGVTGGAFEDASSVRFYDGDPQLTALTPAQIGAGIQIDPLDPASRATLALVAPDTTITAASRGKCERAGVAACVAGATFPDPDGPGTFTVQPLNALPPVPVAGTDFSSAGLDAGGNVIAAFGGDFSGVVPCLDPTEPVLAPRQRGELGPLALDENAGCIPGSFETVTIGGVTQFGNAVTGPENVRYTGGLGENPFRPAPDLSNASNRNASLLQAQGLYYPSAGLRNVLRSGDLDSPRLNFDEIDRAFNRGASQQRTKELKEAYVDLEFLESRLWARLGLQNIVWGKTEVFRTNDQFNPQDLALSSLPSLEESRIALWSGRFVYSLYDVGALEDVRLEFAFNFDRFEPADIGACGEPYAPDLTCNLTYGLLSHSFTGAGIAGIDRPESPWKEIGDLEFGGRIEWRWDRFSFSIIDFYGFDDVPYTEAIFFYERAVDPQSGRPVAARLPGQALGTCQRAGEVAVDTLNAGGGGGVAYNTSFASHPYSVTPGQTPLGGGAVRGGVGTDPGCLRPGGAPGYANTFAFDAAALALTNALEFQSANQQLFAWTCLSTVGVASALDPGACAWTVFASPSNLRGVNVPITEAFVPVFAGDPDGPSTVRTMAIVNNFQRSVAVSGPLIAFPLASVNRLYNDPQAPFDTNNNGMVDNGVGCADDDPATPCDLGGYDGFDTRTQRARFPGQPTLDNSLTNEQRALLGCGPFYGTRCDSTSRETTTADFPQSGNFGGIDLLNAEASAIVQSWLGVEGTLPGQITTDNLPQPGTIGPLGPARGVGAGSSQRTNVPFVGGPTCTRFIETQGLVKLPGCRGIASLSVRYNDPNGIPGDADDVPMRVEVAFEAGYLPSIDGCILGDVINRRGAAASVPVTAVGASPELARQLARCSGATVRRAVPEQFITGFDASGNPTTVPNTGQNPDVAACAPRGFGGTITVNGAPRRVFVCASQEVTLADLPLIHPTAGCIASDTNPTASAACYEWFNRDLVEEFFEGTGQLFQNELAAVSYNFLMFLTLTSCDLRTADLDGRANGDAAGLAANPECFLPSAPYEPGRCSLATPNLCANVKNFLAAVGVRRNTVRAAGNERFGRRTFIWHSGGEAVLRYDRRNVLGFSTDFAEDWSKTSWGVEFTWIEGVPYANNDDPEGITESDSFNVTVSVDRPTFIHFLNPNRTFFFNTQWFASYVPEHREGFLIDGPVDVFATFSVSTGYFQDRLRPQLFTVYALRSRGGAVLPSLEYAFTDSFSVTVGLLYFFGRTQLRPMPINELSPVVNRAGANAYRDGVENGLSAVRKRDEIFMRLRWAF